MLFRISLFETSIYRELDFRITSQEVSSERRKRKSEETGFRVAEFESGEVSEIIASSGWLKDEQQQWVSFIIFFFFKLYLTTFVIINPDKV